MRSINYRRLIGCLTCVLLFVVWLLVEQVWPSPKPSPDDKPEVLARGLQGFIGVMAFIVLFLILIRWGADALGSRLPRPIGWRDRTVPAPPRVKQYGAETAASVLITAKYVCIVPALILLVHGVVRGVQLASASPLSPIVDLRQVFIMDSITGVLLLLFVFFAWIPGLEFDEHGGDGNTSADA